MLMAKMVVYMRTQWIISHSAANLCDSVCVFALHETDHWNVREINVPWYTFYGSVEEK